MTEKRRFLIFILIAFGGGWVMMGLGMALGGMWYQLCLAAAMLTPMLGVLLSHGGLKSARTGIAWVPEMKGRFQWYALAWWGPGALTVVCAALYFALFPAKFDPGLSYLTAQLPADTALPVPPAALAALQFIQAVTIAPLVNMFPAVGEEAGWRGYLTPYLTERLGSTGGLLLSGVIWGAWHWPLILLAGYEYGTGYPGAPYTGMLLMCVFAAAMGILLTWLYERAGSIWAPALCHGALNAGAGIGVYFLRAGETSLFLGPTPAGLAAGIPLWALAVWALFAGAPRGIDI